MSASWVRTLKGMIDRGKATLVHVDAAHTKGQITEEEKGELYEYWYTVHPEDRPEGSAPADETEAAAS